MGRGTLVNATIKQAQANPSSQRDADTNVIHSVEFTPGKVHDSTVLDDLLTGEKESLFADKAYAQKNRKNELRSQGVFCSILDKGWRNRPLSSKQKSKAKS